MASPPAPHADVDAVPGMPRWVKVIAVVAALVVVVLFIATLSGADHGPGRHAPGGHGVSITAPVSGGRDHAAALARTA